MDIRDAFFERLCDAALKDKDIVVLSADTDAFALQLLKDLRPDQYINVGVSEQNAILVATGMAMQGKRPFVYSIIPFITFRVFEQIKSAMCSHAAQVTIVGVGAGLSFSFDGPTHHAVSDIAVMRTLPELRIFNPSNPRAAERAFDEVYCNKGPAYIRLDKGSYPTLPTNVPCTCVYRAAFPPTNLLLILSTGTMTHRAIEVAKRLLPKVCVDVVDVFEISHHYQGELAKAIARYDALVILEENTRSGGIFGLVAQEMVENGISKPTLYLGLPDEQEKKYGSREYLLGIHGLDVHSLVNKIGSWKYATA